MGHTESKEGKGQKRTGRIIQTVAVQNADRVPTVFFEESFESVYDEGGGRVNRVEGGKRGRGE